MALEAPESRKRVPWSLTEQALASLLARIAADSSDAAREFESLRRFLIALLTYSGAADPEHSADITLDRAARRLAEGEEIQNLRAWLRGAARKVLSEERSSSARKATVVFTLQPSEPLSDENDHRILEQCLERLAPESRSLIARYYVAVGNEPLLAARKRLANEFVLSSDALRTRALRLRKILEQCFAEHREKKNG